MRQGNPTALSIPPLALVAMGGHAFMQKGEEGTIQEHERNADRVADLLMTFVARDYRLVVTHGNGPQVGSLLTQQEAARDEAPPMPLDVLVAMTEGSLGYILQQALLNRLGSGPIEPEADGGDAGDGRNGGAAPQPESRRVVTMVTQVVVNGDDPAFDDPAKPIGPFLSEEQARRKADALGWEIREDPTGEGWRRVVPSPKPVEVLQHSMVLDAASQGHIVIAGGGGGIPVVREPGGRYSGVEGVVDKDLTSSVLASDIGASLLVILTAEPCVYRDFGTEDESPLGAVTLEEIEELHREGQFPPGSMGPKVEAVIRFLRRGGSRALITDAESLPRAIEGRAGTHVVGRI